MTTGSWFVSFLKCFLHVEWFLILLPSLFICNHKWALHVDSLCLKPRGTASLLFLRGPNGIFKTWQVNRLPKRRSISCLISLKSCGSSPEPLGGSNLSCSWGGGSFLWSYFGAAEGVLWAVRFVIIITRVTRAPCRCVASRASSLADGRYRLRRLAPVLLCGVAGDLHQRKQREWGWCSPYSPYTTANTDFSCVCVLEKADNLKKLPWMLVFIIALWGSCFFWGGVWLQGEL